MEALVGVAIFAVALIAMIIAFQNLAVLQKSLTARIQAQYLIEEGLEAVRLIRDSDWQSISSLNNGTAYGLSFNSGAQAFSLSAGEEKIGPFYRSVEFADVYRNTENDIAPTGTLEEGLKKVTVKVEWLAGSATTTKQVESYLADLFTE